LATPLLQPFLKWPGGKSDELPLIASACPPLQGRFIDPFVGGGSVLLATPSEVPAWANDACADLIAIYAGALDGEPPPLRVAMDAIAGAWTRLGQHTDLYADLGTGFLAADDASVGTVLDRHAAVLGASVAVAGDDLVDVFSARSRLDLPRKLMRMRRIQLDLGRDLVWDDLLANLEGSIRSSFYMAIRARYNRARRVGEVGPIRSAAFLFLREYAYAAMFRFNGDDEFNVPYGGVSYNRKPFSTKVEGLFAAEMLGRLARTTWRSMDFEPFLEEAAPSADDLVFVDPPYDTEFSAYDNRRFDVADQERLRDVLEAQHARAMLIVKDTPMMRRLYRSDRWHLDATPKTYLWTIKSRNDRSATHLRITNYVPETA